MYVFSTPSIPSKKVTGPFVMSYLEIDNIDDTDRKLYVSKIFCGHNYYHFKKLPASILRFSNSLHYYNTSVIMTY